MTRFKRLLTMLRYDWPLHFVLILTNWLPDNVVVLRFRGWLAGFFIGQCGKDLRLGRGVTFYNPSKIALGEHIYVALGCWFMAGETIEVGNEVLFGPYCVIVSSDHSRSGRSFRYGVPRRRPIKIGTGSWLGAHVTVTGGSSIGPGTAVGASSVVRGEVPADVLVAGQPAKVIRRLEEPL